MGSTEFQKEYITYLEGENNKLRNKISEMKEHLEKILMKDSSKSDLESIVFNLINVCCAMTDEIDEFYEHFSATSAALCSVLKRKSQMVQLSKKLSGLLHSFEQIDPELELIDANNMACFAKRLSDGKSSNQKRGTAKVSPMINGLTISTDPRIRLNRVTHEIANRHRRISEAPALSPVVELSPATPPARNQRQIFFREIQISVPRLNISSDGQVIHRNVGESPRTSKCVQKINKPLATRLINNSHLNQRNSESQAVAEEDSEELAGEEEKENLINEQSSSGDETIRGGDNSDVEGEESSPDCSKEKNISVSCSEPNQEPLDPLEGPSWLLDDHQDRRESRNSSSFNYVNVRRQRGRFFSGSSRDDSVDSQKLDTVVEQNESDEIDDRQEQKNVKILIEHDSLETSDMEMTECLPVVRHNINNPVNTNLSLHEKVATPVTDTSTGINSSAAKSETSFDATERKLIEESSEEDEDEGEGEIDASTAATCGSDGSKLRSVSSNSPNLDHFNDKNERTLKVILEKHDSIASSARTDSTKSSPSPKSSTKESTPEAKMIDLKKPPKSLDTDSRSLSSPEKIEKAGDNNNTPLTAENQGRPKRGAALRCMEQKVWITSTPESDKNKNKNKNKSFKTKRKQEDKIDSSPNEKKKIYRSFKNDKEDESNIDSDTSTQDSVPSSPPPQSVKTAKVSTSTEICRPNNQTSTGNTSSLFVEEKKKRRKGPLSSQFSSFDETNRTMDKSILNNGSVVEEEGRRKRRAAPGSLKEPSVKEKLRRNP